MLELENIVKKCIDREQLCEGIYAQIYWSLFVNKLSIKEVIWHFKARLEYFDGMKRSNFKHKGSITTGILDTEWTKNENR